MRRVIVSEFVTLDGVMEAPDMWSFQFMNEETAKYNSTNYLQATLFYWDE